MNNLDQFQTIGQIAELTNQLDPEYREIMKELEDYLK
jgi:hypothetical protein